MFTWRFFFSITSVYLSTVVYQFMPWVKPEQHDAVTAFTYGYGILFALSTVDTLFSFGNVDHHLPHENRGWVLSCHAGALGFSLLSSVPYLADISITAHTHLSPAQLTTFIFFGAAILWMAVRQFRHGCSKKCRNHVLTAYFAFVAVYGFSALVIFESGSKAHFHLHHAISASILSLWFTDFATWTDVMMNGILIGVVIQGLSFYHISEAYLFIIDHDQKVPEWLAIILLLVAEVGWIMSMRPCKRTLATQPSHTPDSR